MQNASLPSHSIPQAAMSHLSASGQIVLPNGAIAMVDSYVCPCPVCVIDRHNEVVITADGKKDETHNILSLWSPQRGPCGHDRGC